MSQLSANAHRILHELPDEGTKVGNIALRNQLGMGQEVYLKAREELLRAGLIEIGQGRGGSVGRKIDESTPLQRNPLENPSSKSENPGLSTHARRILHALPGDGTKLGNMAVRERLGLDPEIYIEARRELEKSGLVITGFGRGGSVGRAKRRDTDVRTAEYMRNLLRSGIDEAVGNVELSVNAQRILNALPKDGTKVGNIGLRERLEMDRDAYIEARNELAREDLVAIGQGKGGSVGRAISAEGQAREDTLNERSPQRESVKPWEAQGQKQTDPKAPTSEELPTETEELDLDDSDVDDEFGDVNIQERHIFSDKSDPSIADLYARYKDGELILQPDFQRQFIWDFRKCSRLIESAILEVPLPMIYLAEEPDGREVVIDGQQRLTAFFKFVDSEYPLTGLRVMKELNGNHFMDLDRSIQSTIRRCSIRTTTIKKESSDFLKFEIFERLNTGAMALNDQELRNCIYRGSYNDLLKNLSQDEDFRYLIGITRLERRMRDVELVLRFAAFYHASYLNYASPMREFLNNDMMQHQNISQTDADDLRRAFKNSLHIIRSLFAEHAFRRFYRGTSENANGYWESKQFSASLYDVLMYSFSKTDKHQIFQHLDEIREAFICCMTEDDDFIETIERGTSNKGMVTRRFDKWRLILESILSSSQRDPRCFSRTLKEQLFSCDPTCAICGQRIQDIDDAAVDHIEQYGRGGRTIPENARITHRFCNWSRPRKA